MNFAAETHVDRSIGGPRTFLRTDILGTHTLLEAVRELGIAAHGAGLAPTRSTARIETGAFCESRPHRPVEPVLGEQGRRRPAGARLPHAPSARRRSSRAARNTYGPYQYPEKLIPLFVTNALEGQQLPLYGDGLNVRDWLHVDDHADGIDVVLRDGAPGRGLQHRRRQRAHQPRDHAPSSSTSSARATSSSARHRPPRPRPPLLHRLRQGSRGWAGSREVDFEAGLRDTIGWYRDNRVVAADQVGRVARVLRAPVRRARLICRPAPCRPSRIRARSRPGSPRARASTAT